MADRPTDARDEPDAPGDRLVAAVRAGEVDRLAALLDREPDALRLRTRPYGWTLLHHAAHAGQDAVVELLLARGLGPDVREEGDDTTPMHWAAAGGHLDVVRRLAAAGGDVVGAGDDHELGVIGWATCWEGCGDAPHRAVADFLVERGARHHIFSAVATGRADEVRRIVAADPTALARRMSRNESHQLPIHFAVRMNRAAMVDLLLELGADPAAADGMGMPVAAYAASPAVGRRIVEALAGRGVLGLFGALALGDEAAAARLLARRDPSRPADAAALHLLAKRGEAPGVRWLLDRGADPNARWGHWGAEVTPLHLAAAQGHAEIVRMLLAAGGDPRIRDGLHGGDAAGWAEFGRVPAAPAWREIVGILEGHGARG